MTRRTLRKVNRFAACGLTRRPLDHLQDPRHLIGVDEQEMRFWIERSAAPFAAAVETGKHDCALTPARHELAVVAYCLQGRDDRVVSLRLLALDKAVGQPRSRK